MEEFEDLSDSDDEETLDKAVKSLNEKGLYDTPGGNAFFYIQIGTVDLKKMEMTPTFTKHAEVVDDYIRNYLASRGLLKSLETFQVIENVMVERVVRVESKWEIKRRRSASGSRRV